MATLKNDITTFSDTKPHYALLDGLRGVAALLVIWYHVFEGFAFAGGGIISTLNHGYLAVDFFFMLSGFVIGYAYDDRWNSSLTTKQFFLRRIIRLHPMVIAGAIIGTIAFLTGGSTQWNGTHIAISGTMVAMLCSMLFIPAIAGHSHYEVRGNGEMFPLNGPQWSLFFEYIGNILYALIIRRLSTRALSVVVAMLGITQAWFTIGNVSEYGFIGVGWTLDTMNFFGGLLRMLFPFSSGILLSRNFKPVKIRYAFPICSALLIALFSVPYLPEVHGIHLNGIYEYACIMLVFPLIVWLGASGTTSHNRPSAICNFLGNISYPVYIVHYPLMYLFYSWLIDNKLYTIDNTWLMATAVFFGSILLAYACLELIDKPIRRQLSRLFINKSH